MEKGLARRHLPGPDHTVGAQQARLSSMVCPHLWAQHIQNGHELDPVAHTTCRK